MAAESVLLSADGDIDLSAARNTAQERSRSEHSSASVSATYNGSWSFSASAQSGQGAGDGQEASHHNTRIEAGRLVQLESGGDTALAGAVVAADTVKATVGGHLRIQSLQDTSVWREASSQKGGSASSAGGASANASRTRIEAEHSSVAQQSGIRAGDGGFQVEVTGQTELKGGAITSTQVAVDLNRNRFESEGGVTLADVQNNARFEASSVSVSAGVGSQLGNSGAGVGTDKGSTRSTTVAAISGIAGHTSARTGDAETGIATIFDKDKVRDEVQAQVVITKAFGQQAVKAGAQFADSKAIELRRQGNEAEARKWDEGGEYRVAMHTAIGALGGGVAGAVGAGAGAAVIPTIGEAIAGMNLPEPVRQGLTQVAGAVVGSATGGTAGTAASLNQTALNYVSHSPYARVRQLVSQENARLTNACGAACTAEDFRRIDQQVATLERAGNLAEIARHSGLTPEQGQQFAQLTTELLPIYGSAESVAQLITGKSTLTGEEVSRFWAAVGVVPLAGGAIRKLAEPSEEFIAAVMRNNVYRDGGDPEYVSRMFQEAAKNSTNNAHSSVVVLGRYLPDNVNSYEQVAQRMGATYFQMPDWDEVSGIIGSGQM
ncbi:hemagglutinin repeat-containing protein [Hydrogenophaga sp.]|uniref:hemagglutinin repeat-containing protein n=1 Tax=Hydrogenophaga sp. TaxID=1904254 RepID=UPI003D14C944